jgi:hypothetical protein
MQEIVDQLRNSGQAVPDEDLARIWPLLHEHLLPNGIYDFAGAEGWLTRGLTWRYTCNTCRGRVAVQTELTWPVRAGGKAYVTTDDFGDVGVGRECRLPFCQVAAARYGIR